MYKFLLILKYLRKRRIAWVSLIAVALCTAMVIVVISVMGGWLNMFRSINHGLVGDVIIRRKTANGFDHYEEILADVRKMPEVKAAVPMVYSYAAINIDDQIHDAVQVEAYGDLDQVGDVNSFKHGLYRQYIQPLEEIENDTSLSAAEKAKEKAALEAKPPSFDKPLDPQVYRDTLPGKGGFDASQLPGMIVGTAAIIEKNDDGTEKRPWTYQDAFWVKMTVLSMSGDELTPGHTDRTYWIVDDCSTKFYPVDAKTVYVPFDILQKDLGMNSYTYQRQVGDKLVDEVSPARTNEIEIAFKDGVDPEQGLAAVEKLVNDFANEYPFELALPGDPLRAESWGERQGEFLSAVAKEKVLVTFLFGIISIVAVFLVFCIFFMIVVEKTRDIGIIKSVGASNAGVAQIFLGYGLLIGVMGAGIGLLFSYLIVHNINQLHAWLGREMGIVIWDPKTYAFDTIPNTMDPHDVAWIVAIAILSALLGAIVPAWRASRMNPVEALRWE
jgi:lipoprotein-releasing system permease protein